jgi:arsenate reductase-like glutaredoxin family protein
VKPWLNSHNAEYRRLGLKDRTPDADEAAALIAGHNNLLRRPVLQVPDAAAPGGLRVVVGNDLAGAAAALGRDAP